MVAEGTQERRRFDEVVGGEEKVFRGRDEYSSNMFNSIIALAIWLGAIHFTAALVLLAVFFLSLSKALLFVSVPSLVTLFDFCSQFVFSALNRLRISISGFLVCFLY